MLHTPRRPDNSSTQPARDALPRSSLRRATPRNRKRFLFLGSILLVLIALPVLTTLLLKNNNAEASPQPSTAAQKTTQKSTNAGFELPNKPASAPFGCAKTPQQVTAVHADSVDRKNEHLAMLALVSYDKVTHIAGNGGNWSDPKTWCGQKVPGKNANVLIPQDTTVVYDAKSTDALHTIRIDGTLTFSTTTSTQLVVDTIVQDPRGTLVIGTQQHPIPANVTANITFADSGPIDTKWDPLQFSRGLVAHGTVSMYGNEKTTFLPIASDAKVGSSSLQLAQAPVNWQVGDMLVLTGIMTGRSDEERTIQAINGSTVTLNAPLKYDHTPPASDLKSYVANYTHNIRFTSANTKDVLRRGQVMFMHTNLVQVSYVEFRELGRTNKAEWADDPGVVRVGPDHTTQGKGLNPRGRYAVHFHFAGIKGDSQAIVRGSSVIGSPGWGFVTHQSNVLMEDNAAYNILGASFVAEDGNEIGSMIHNIAIGSNQHLPDHRVYHNPHTPNILQDMWADGTGFAFRGNGVKVRDNVCSNQAFECYSWNGWDAQENIMVPRENLLQPALASNKSAVNFHNQPIDDFSGNTAIAIPYGVHLDQPLATPTDARNILKDTTIWNTGTLDPAGRGGFIGFHIRYGTHVTIIGARLHAVGFPQNDPRWLAGIETGPETDNVIIKANIKGFRVAVDNLAGIETGDTQWESGTSILDSDLTGNTKQITSNDPKYLKYVGSSATIDQKKLQFVQDGGLETVHPWKLVYTHYGTIIDGLGKRTTAVSGEPNNKAPGYAQNFTTDTETLRSLVKKGYYSDQNGTYIVTEYAMYNRITGASVPLYAKVKIDLKDWQASELGPNLGAFK